MEFQPGDKVRFVGKPCHRTNEAGVKPGDILEVEHVWDRQREHPTWTRYIFKGNELVLLQEDLEAV
jgi:hypothetical protein